MVNKKDDDDLLLDFLNEDNDWEDNLGKRDININTGGDYCCLTVPQKQEQERDFTTTGLISPEAVEYEGLYNYNYNYNYNNDCGEEQQQRQQ
jgi:hypothetical protein